MLIAKLDDLAELYVIAVNFTDASGGANKVFADYDAHVEVQTDRDETHVINLYSRNPGSSVRRRSTLRFRPPSISSPVSVRSATFFLVGFSVG